MSGSDLTGTKHYGEICCRHQVPLEHWYVVDLSNFCLIHLFYLHRNWLN